MLWFEFSTQVINNQSMGLLAINRTRLLGNQLFKTRTRFGRVCIKYAFATL
jgi:hypothetical protein